MTIVIIQRRSSAANDHSVVLGSGEFHTDNLRAILMFCERPNPRLSGLVRPHYTWGICMRVKQQGQARGNPTMAVCDRPDVSCWVDVTRKPEHIRVLPPYISSGNKCGKTMPINVSVNNDAVYLHDLAVVSNQERPFPIEMKPPSDQT